MKTKMRSRLRCVALEERVTPSAGYYNDFLNYIVPKIPFFEYVAANTGSNGGGFTTNRQSDQTVIISTSNSDSFVVARTFNDGTIDTSFGINGLSVIPLPSTMFAAVQSTVFQSDGTIFCTGPAGSNFGPGSFATVKLSPEGAVDLTYGVNGVANPDPRPIFFADFRLHTTYADDQGRLIVAGLKSIQRNLCFLRLDATGNLDPSFGNSGIVETQIQIPIDIQYPDGVLELQPSTGRILYATAYKTATTHGSDFGLIALTSQGILDSSFGTNGIATAAFDQAVPTLGQWPGNKSDVPLDLLIRADGTVTVVGWSNRSVKPTTSNLVGYFYGDRLDDLGIAQFTPNGQLDPSFDHDGKLIVDLVGPTGQHGEYRNGSPRAFLKGSANSILAYAAYDRIDGYLYNQVTRIQSNGQIDQSYGTSGTIPLFIEYGTPWATETPALTQPILPTDFLAGGTNSGKGTVLQTSSSGQVSISNETSPFFNGIASVRTVTADVNGDGVPDLIGGSGPGGGPHVIVIDGQSKFRMAEFFAFEQTFFGGINVAAGDLNGDGKAEIIVTPDRGGGPIVAVYDGAKLAEGFNNDAQLTRFFGIEDKNFRGGARAAIGDVSGDGTADLLVSAGFEGGPRIALFDGTGIAPGTTPPPKLIPDFFAFEDTLRNGAYVTLGDLNGDGQAELVFGGGPGGAPRVRAFDGKGLLAAGPFTSLDDIPDAQLANFYAGDADRRGGIRLAIKAIDGSPALLAASGENEAAQLRVFPAATLLGSANPQPSQVLDLFGGAVLADGVFVG